MKRLFLLIILLMFNVFVTAFCQSPQLVFDPTSYWEMVKQTDHWIKSLKNDLKEIQYLYDMVQYQIESLKKLDPTSIQGIDSYVKGQIRGLNNIKYRIDNLQFESWNGEVYKLGDFVFDPEEIQEYYDRYMEAVEKGDTKQARYYYDKIIEFETSNRAYLNQLKHKAFLTSAEAEKFHQRSTEQLDAIIEDIEDNQSLTSQLQISNMLGTEMTLALQMILQVTDEMKQMFAIENSIETIKDYTTDETDTLNTEWSDEAQDYLDHIEDQTVDPFDLYNY